MADQQYTIEEIGQRVRASNPKAFVNFTDAQIGQRIAEKNPQVQSLVKTVNPAQQQAQVANDIQHQKYGDAQTALNTPLFGGKLDVLGTSAKGLSGGLDFFQKGLDVVGNLPVIKQVGQGLTAAGGALGGLAGGTVGAATQIAGEGLQKQHPIISSLLQSLINKIPTDQKQQLHNKLLETQQVFQPGVTPVTGTTPSDTLHRAVQNAKSTSQFGKTAGEKGAQAAPLALLGEVPATLLALSQLQQGGKETAGGIINKNPEQATQGLFDLLMSGVATRQALKSPGGSLINPDVKNQIKRELQFLKYDAQGKNSAVEAPKAAIEKNTGTYREVLRPTQGEIKNIEVRKGQDINKTYQFMVEHQLPIGKSVEGKLDTTDARAQLDTQSEPVTQQLNTLLDSRPQQDFNLIDIANNAKKEVDASNLSAIEKKDRKANIDEIINAEAEQRFGPTWKEDGTQPVVTGSDLNTIKQGFWKMGYRIDKPTAHTTARLLGFSAKDAIEKAYNDPQIKALNERLGQYAQANRLLENAHGRVIRGGQLGRMMAGLSGGVIGSTMHVPIVGPLLGKVSGELLSDYATNPERITNKATQRLQNAQDISQRPSLLGLLKKKTPGLSIEDVSNGKPTKSLSDLLIKKEPDIT